MRCAYIVVAKVSVRHCMLGEKVAPDGQRPILTTTTPPPHHTRGLLLQHGTESNVLAASMRRWSITAGAVECERCAHIFGGIYMWVFTRVNTCVNPKSKSV